MTQIELEHLSDFVSSPGWAWFADFVTREWGPSGVRYQQAVQAASEKQDAVVELQKVLSAQRAVLEMMRYPAEQLSVMRQKAKADLGIVSRRGPGL